MIWIKLNESRSDAKTWLRTFLLLLLSILSLRLAHVYNNTIHSAVCGIRIADPALESHAVVGNAVFAEEPLALHRSMVRVEENLTGSVAEASGHLADPASFDFHPLPGRCEGPPLDLSAFQSDTAFDVDFDGTAKGDRRFRGACAGPAKAGSWRLQRGMKP